MAAKKAKTSAKQASVKKSTAAGTKTLAAKQAEIKITQKRTFSMRSLTARLSRSKKGGEPNVKVETLRGLNKWFALFYAAAGLATALFAVPHEVPLQISHLMRDELLSTNSDPVFSYAVTQLSTVSIHWLLATWLVLLAVVHGLLATKLRKQAEQEIAQDKATASWLFGGVLYGLGAVIVLLLVGGYDVALLGLAFAASVAAGVAGWLATRTGTWLRSGLALATALALLPLGAIKLFLGTAALQGADVPLGIYITATTFVVGTLLILVVAWLHLLRKGTGARPTAWAAITTVLAFVFAVATAGQIFAGVLW